MRQTASQSPLEETFNIPAAESETAVAPNFHLRSTRQNHNDVNNNDNNYNNNVQENVHKQIHIIELEALH